MDGGRLKGLIELTSVAQITEAHDRIGDRRAHVGAHDHRHGDLDRHPARDEADDDRGNGTRGLHERSREGAQNDADDGIAGEREKPLGARGAAREQPKAIADDGDADQQRINEPEHAEPGHDRDALVGTLLVLGVVLGGVGHNGKAHDRY